MQGVHAGAAVEDVRTRPARQEVAAPLPEQGVRSESAVQLVVTGAAVGVNRPFGVMPVVERRPDDERPAEPLNRAVARNSGEIFYLGLVGRRLERTIVPTHMKP